MYKSKIKVAIETVKRALAFEDRVSVTKKWRALPFKKKKKLAPDVLLITLCFILLGPEKKLAEKMVYSHWMPVGNVSSDVLHQIYIFSSFVFVQLITKFFIFYFIMYIKIRFFNDKN